MQYFQEQPHQCSKAERTSSRRKNKRRANELRKGWKTAASEGQLPEGKLPLFLISILNAEEKNVGRRGHLQYLADLVGCLWGLSLSLQSRFQGCA
ncbi:hypothetical protein KP509_27G050000 [Ceratopteris richardii]|uniref:Uncharacterized protein n=1 Tax=Ceratopteris richardii TaxID=49495 RepID=A0A8T2RI19_CERRI|nr:hypothetical protein KP509_27G050000 [Ceratopteris richardii]